MGLLEFRRGPAALGGARTGRAATKAWRGLAMTALLVGLSTISSDVLAGAAPAPNAGRLVAEAFAWAHRHASVELSARVATGPQQSISMLLTPSASETITSVAGYGTSSVIRVNDGHVTYVNVSSLAQLSSLEVTTATAADENVWFTVSPSDPRDAVLTQWSPLTVRSVFSYGRMGFQRPFRYVGLTTLRGVRVIKLATRSFVVSALGPQGTAYLYLTDTKDPRPYAGRSGTGKNADTMYFTHWDGVTPIPVPTGAPALPQ